MQMVVRLLSLFLLATLLSSCSAVQPQDAPIATSTPMVDELLTMTPPERKVPVAVYKFNDLTGQRKTHSNLALLSSAVTQGGDIWLLQALKKAGNGKWFQVIERMELENLLKERQIIRNTRNSYEGKKAEKIKPLLFAGVLLTGGIVGYDTNTSTGGLGVRYLGIGISDEYRKDMVTVALRLISVQTGEVLIAVSSQKTILSTKLSATVFKFLDMGTKLLETEAGITDNESTTYAVRKAIEQAVIEIIKEGEQKKLWEFKKEEIK
jgi:curli production assembly/transport component CsgG